jgi:RimJ/RimL family protein N-acetyltransferase
MDSIILGSKHYEVKKYTGIPPEAIDFLERISWGSEGAVYVNMNMKNHIHELYNPVLIAILEKEKIQGTTAFCHTDIKVVDKSYNCYYIKYFAAAKEVRGKGVAKLITQKVMQSIRAKEAKKTIYFAFVEKANKASYNVVKSSGYDELGTIKTIGFSRFFPKWDNRIVNISDQKEKTQIIKLLSEKYKDHVLVQFNSIFHKNNYFVIRENDEIVAGCQYHKGHWKINKMKGTVGKLIILLAPHLPLIRKIFNPNKFEFLAFEGIYFKKGYENDLHKLFEGLLAKEKLNSALIWMGENCPVRKNISDFKNLGLIHTFVKDSDVKVMASFNNIGEEVKEIARKNPMYASAFDFV